MALDEQNLKKKRKKPNKYSNNVSAFDPSSWVDVVFDRTGSGPTVMPHPGDPGYSMQEIAARQAARQTGKGNILNTPNLPNSASERQSDLSRQALRDAANLVNQSQIPQLPQQPVAADPLSLIFEQLLKNSQMSGNSGLSDKEIRKLAEEQIKMQFDPQIKLLKDQMAERKNRFEYNRNIVDDLYNDLANQYKDFGGDAGNSYGDAINAQNMQRQTTDQNMQQNYENSLNYQTEEFNKLGIGDVAQVTYPQQQQDLQYQQQLNNNESDAFNNWAMQNQAADQSYYDKMAKNSGLHRAESTEDLLRELNTYLDTTQGQIGTLQSQQSTGLNTLIQQMMQQRAEQQAQIEKDNWNRLLQSGEFGIALQNLQLSQQRASQQNQTSRNQDPTSGLLGATNILSQASNPQHITGLFQQLMLTQPFREGRFQAADGTIIDMTPQQAAEEARKFGLANGLSSSDLTQFINAVYAFYGKLGR